VHEFSEWKPDHSFSRREALRRLAYVAPVVLTLPAKPSFVSAGSHKEHKEDKDKKEKKDKNK
jgi:hypothetical protein